MLNRSSRKAQNFLKIEKPMISPNRRGFCSGKTPPGFSLSSERRRTISWRKLQALYFAGRMTLLPIDHDSIPLYASENLREPPAVELFPDIENGVNPV
jgi:hypothetical protein